MPSELASSLEALSAVYMADGHPGKAVGLLAEAIAALDTNSPEVQPAFPSAGLHSPASGLLLHASLLLIPS